jgi:hypothetical protein
MTNTEEEDTIHNLDSPTELPQKLVEATFEEEKNLNRASSAGPFPKLPAVGLGGDWYPTSAELLAEARVVPNLYSNVDRPPTSGVAERTRRQYVGTPGDGVRFLDASEVTENSRRMPREEVTTGPRGILKPPTEKFPDDPNPIREGVAPLKDARKDGVPPDARWTKINRKLVSLTALELGKERFEAREDFVIVLRVLSREEVQGYAEVTQIIRGKCNQISLY